ncbi:MAG: DUF5058 family protein [Clostridioides sp.]|jgi:hypothetical protein|nr:DUF5058 family protein [Clostridioides sp.]
MNQNYLEIANSPLMWIAAAIPVAVVIFQAVVFLRRSIVASTEMGLSKKQVDMAIKSSIISSIGPSIVILVTMVSLIVTMGGPIAWLRLSFIGSVSYETMAAGFGAQAMNTTLDAMNPLAYSCAVWTMILGSLGWIIFTLLFTDKMEKVNSLLSNGNEKLVPIVSTGAMLGAFANLAGGNFFNQNGGLIFTTGPAVATIAGCIIMMCLTYVANSKNLNWLKEWSFAIAIFAGMFAGYFVAA